jgi:hypothetical protein
MADSVGTASTTSRSEVTRAIWFWTWVLALGGVALLATAAVDLIRDSGDGAVVALAFVGLGLAFGPLVFPRLYRFSAGGQGYAFELSREIADLKAPHTADLIDRQGAGLAEAAYAYATAHTVLRYDGEDPARARLQDHFVNTASASALAQAYDRAEVQRLFRNGPPVVRVLVLGLMLGDPSLADAATIGSAITESRSGDEQYHGLRLALVVGPRLPPEERASLSRAIANDPAIGRDPDRSRLGARVLDVLAGGVGAGGERVSGDDADQAPSGDDAARAAAGTATATPTA